MKQTIFWLLGLFATSCSIQAIEVIDAGIYLSSNHFSNVIYWLDDDNLLVAGVPVERKPSDPSGTRLLRYRIANRSVTDMGQIGGGLCVSNGVVRFWRPTPETADKPLSQQKKVSLSGRWTTLSKCLRRRLCHRFPCPETENHCMRASILMNWFLLPGLKKPGNPGACSNP